MRRLADGIPQSLVGLDHHTSSQRTNFSVLPAGKNDVAIKPAATLRNEHRLKSEVVGPATSPDFGYLFVAMPVTIDR